MLVEVEQARTRRQLLAGGRPGQPRVHAHSHAQRPGLGPPLAGQVALRRQAGRRCVAGVLARAGARAGAKLCAVPD